jgi:hypothetical protein
VIVSQTLKLFPIPSISIFVIYSQGSHRRLPSLYSLWLMSLREERIMVVETLQGQLDQACCLILVLI